jgi:hypothetical protein
MLCRERRVSCEAWVTGLWQRVAWGLGAVQMRGMSVAACNRSHQSYQCKECRVCVDWHEQDFNSDLQITKKRLMRLPPQFSLHLEMCCTLSSAKRSVAKEWAAHHRMVLSPSSINCKCIAGNRTWLYRLPQSQKTMYIFSKAYCYCVKHEKISSSAPGLGLMTHCEYRVDCPFPVTWLGFVRTIPPPAVQAWADYLTLAFRA